jgi:hypothetical protein
VDGGESDDDEDSDYVPGDASDDGGGESDDDDDDDRQDDRDGTAAFENDDTVQIAGVDDDESTVNDAIEAEDDTNNERERSYQPAGTDTSMNLRRQARKSYKYDRMGNQVTLGDSNLLINVKTTSSLPKIAGVAMAKREHKHFLFHQMGVEVEECTGMMLLQYDKDHNLLETEIDEYDIEYIFLTEQMNWKKGLKLFKEKGEDAISSELKQIHDMEGFQPKQ